MRVSASCIKGRSMDDVEQVAFHEIAHAAEWRFTTAEQWERETDRLIRWRERGGILRISRSSAKIEEVLRSAGYDAKYDPVNGRVELGESARSEALAISWYAVSEADDGMQDSELIAEAIRFVAVNGFGKNRLADTVAGVFISGD